MGGWNGVGWGVLGADWCSLSQRDWKNVSLPGHCCAVVRSSHTEMTESSNILNTVDSVLVRVPAHTGNVALPKRTS